MRFAALGRTQLLYKAVEAAISSGHELVMVGTAPASPEYSVDQENFRALAEQQNCPYFCDAKINKAEYVEMAKKSQADIAFSVNWPLIVGREIRQAFPLGVVNSHAGDLPRFRGNACPNWAILTGEESVTVTLHQMDAGLDSGDILLQEKIPLDENTYIGAVYQSFEQIVPTLFVELLERYERGAITPRPQSTDPEEALRCFPRRPEDSVIDWKDSAENIARLVRASSEPFAGAFAQIKGEILRVWRAKPVDLGYKWLGMPGQIAAIRKDGTIAVLCGQGALLIELVSLDNGERLLPNELIRSIRERLC